MTEIEQSNSKGFKFQKRHILSIVSFAIFLQLAIFLNMRYELALIWRIILSILPVISFVFFMINMIESIKKDDEMFLKIMAQALTYTSVITLTWTLAVGIMQQLEVLPMGSFYFVFFIMAGTFSLSYLLAMKKYC